MYKNRDKKNMIKLSGIALLTALTVGIGGTSAVIRHQVELKNEISADTVQVKVTEELGGEISEHVKPKKIQFENTGTADVFLRVAYSETWTDKEGNLLSNKMPDSKADVASKVNFLDGWHYENGWYYYPEVLTSGSVTDSVLENVDFSKIFDSPEMKEDEKQLYQNANYEIHFQTEAVQASDEWKVSEEAVAELFNQNISAEANGEAIDEGQNEDKWPSSKNTAVINWGGAIAGGGN